MRLSMCVEFLSFMMLFMRGSFVFSVKQRYKFEASKNDKDVLPTDDLSCVIYSWVLDAYTICSIVQIQISIY